MMMMTTKLKTDDGKNDRGELKQSIEESYFNSRIANLTSLRKPL